MWSFFVPMPFFHCLPPAIVTAIGTYVVAVVMYIVGITWSDSPEALIRNKFKTLVEVVL